MEDENIKIVAASMFISLDTLKRFLNVVFLKSQILIVGKKVVQKIMMYPQGILKNDDRRFALEPSVATMTPQKTKTGHQKKELN